MKNRLRPIQMNRISKASVAALMLTLVVFAGGTALRADSRDTIDDVIRVGRDARAGLTEFEGGLRQAQAITARLAQDRAFAAAILELAKKDDKTGIANKLVTVVPGSQITVKSIRDFTMDITICTKSLCYNLCIGDDCKHPSGAKSPVVFSQF
jgi:hypothetical protein